MKLIDPEQAQELAKLKHDAVPAAIYTTAGTITVWGIGIDQIVSLLAAILTALQLIKFIVEHRKGISIVFKKIWEVLTCWRK